MICDRASARGTEGREAMWEELVINMMLGVLRVVIKNPAKAAELKLILLEVRDAINGLYPGA